MATTTTTTSTTTADAANPQQHHHHQQQQQQQQPQQQPERSASSLKVVTFLADNGQDPSESALPWSIFKQAGCTVHFATEHGAVAAADPLPLQSTVFAGMLGATQHATEAYRAMTDSPEHRHPRSWSDEGFDILDYGCSLPLLQVCGDLVWGLGWGLGVGLGVESAGVGAWC